MLPTRGRKPATSGEAIGVSDSAAARRGGEQIAGRPSGLPRRNSNGVRAPDKQQGGVAAAGWPRGSALFVDGLWGTSPRGRATGGGGSGGLPCDGRGDQRPGRTPCTDGRAGMSPRTSGAGRGSAARRQGRCRETAAAISIPHSRSLSLWTNSGEGERPRDAAGISAPRGRPREDVVADERRGGVSADTAADDTAGRRRQSAPRVDSHDGMSPRTSGGAGDQPRDGRGNQRPAQTAVGGRHQGRAAQR